MRIEVNLKYKPRKDDIIIFDGSEWIVMHVNQLTNNLREQLNGLSDRVLKLEKDINLIKGE